MTDYQYYYDKAIALAKLNNWTPNDNLIRALIIKIQKQESNND